jgi:hypothetical protein
MNLYGVALASDTLASRRVDDGFKTTDGNNKIWSIPGHNVQVLHYGSTFLGETPHKIQFEAWTRTLTKPLATVTDYVKSYQAYCASAKSVHGRNSEYIGVKRILKNYLERLNNKTQGNIAEEYRNFENFYKNSEKFDGTTNEWVTATITKFKIDLDELIKEVFDQPLDTKTKNSLKRGMKQFMIAAWDLTWDTNLVFIGFGAKDEFAGSQRLLIRGIFNQRLLAVTEEALYVHPDHIDSRIIYAAQSDAMKGFIQGYTPRFGNKLEDTVKRHITDFLDAKKFENWHAPKIADAIADELLEFSRNTFINPAFHAIMNMSPEQLANAARGLVALEAAAASISSQVATVGGPIEVSTITKKDGVGWATS